MSVDEKNSEIVRLMGELKKTQDELAEMKDEFSGEKQSQLVFLCIL
jgi:hypothetical protein